MRILILDGNPDDGRAEYEAYLDSLAGGLGELGHEVDHVRLRSRDIRFCTGCWTCWVKTPGKCVFSDDAEQVHRDYMSSDRVLFVTPVIMGFLSTLIVKLQDRLIPLLHPYIVIENGESHHRKRYGRYPEVGLILEKRPDTDEEDLSITQENFKRFAVNFKSPLRVNRLIDGKPREAVHEIGRV
ncbi:MAG: flavodoxin family protein [Planctomycetota bacterium]|jgi:multimeric flavodoxin WrbA